jgi:6-phosphogluconate dehydrogenase
MQSAITGCGVSGGEEGARYGPSLMPGGAPEAWPYVKSIFQSVAAKVQGEPCCEWVSGQIFDNTLSSIVINN